MMTYRNQYLTTEIDEIYNIITSLLFDLTYNDSFTYFLNIKKAEHNQTLNINAPY